MGSGMALQVECVVEAFTAEGTQIALDVAVTFHMTVEKSLQWEHLLADFAEELVIRRLFTC